MALFWQRPMRLIVLLLLSCLPALVGQAPAGEIQVEVKDGSGAAVEAHGWLEGLHSGFRRSFQCDRRGLGTVSGLPAGRYRLRLTKEGFATYTETLEIAGNAAVQRTIRLEIGASSYAVSVVSATPLAGLDRLLEEMPAPAKAATDRDLEASGALDVSDFLNRRLANVYVNEIQGNPLQPDVNFRGYTASPLLGTPQGVSVYMDGVRLNQPFGDVVSWDLIPRVAVAEMAMIAGSDPLFGLNTLGGALSLRTKDGISHPGTSVQLSGGSFGRKTAELEHGGSTAKGLHWYLASSLFFEDGWRASSPSNVRQFLGKIGRQRERTSIGLTLAYANNTLIGNGLQELRLLERDYRSVYTKPDQTANRSPFVNLQLRHSFSNALTFSGNAYFRHIRTRTLNGDINENSLDQSVYQPGAAERAALTAAGYTGFPTSGATAANTPFPFWRCIGNVLLGDEPGEKCNGLINRGASQQRNYGLSGQVSWFGRMGRYRNQLTAGAAYDGNSVGFEQSSELGYLAPDRSVVGTGAFGDGVTGGDVDGEPFDVRVNLSGRMHSASVYATDTLTAGRLNLTVSGRFNRTTIDNLDRIRPAAGSGSLTGWHEFRRFNPAAGATYRVTGAVSLYGGYTEGSRAPTSIELGCADPETPCKLPNAMAGDPPLQQVVTRTFEAGVRGSGEHGLRWSAGWFRATNHDDILFVASQQTGFGYFKNFETTRRQGLELDMSARAGRVTYGGGYTFLRATFESSEAVNGSGNSSNDLARTVSRGLEGTIEIEPGSHIPLIPSHLVKAYADVQVTSKLLVDLNVIGASGSYARGNENNQHQPDGTYYLGPGRSAGYGVVNLGARYQLHRRVELFARINNLLDRCYYSAAQLGPTGFTAQGNFVARPFPATSNGEYPVQQSTFYAPGAPRGAWAGLRLRF
ncbi:TonB-dependent receptor [Paludibaculum fermentans]|uniref:TonB-dependent receptor n=1 Tax=Paludibaculum fermentans TaxID=1473598 RepID=A0A7S7NQ45_PALFE|nr:TonB-dependent receptor [Paludibaculum fermentans]QOY87675.1 TonB-dependent receptor [Paludibaculum fermentans]